MPESESRPFAGIQLENGLAVRFYDLSRPVAGDRWQVRLVMVIPIRVLPEYFSDCDNPEEIYAACIAALGEVVEFRQERIRQFVAEKDRQDILEKIQHDFRESVLMYASRPGFAASYVLKRYNAHKEEQGIQRAHAEALSKNRQEDD